MTSRDEVVDVLFQKVRKLEGSADPAFDEIFKRLRRLDRRVSELEKWKWKIVGAGMALAGLVSLVK